VTLIAFLLSVLIGCVSLAYGYSQAGMSEFARGFALLGATWIWAHWRKQYWASSAAFFLMLCGAAYGVWNGFVSAWMMLGAFGGLLGWNLSDFTQRLSYARPTDDVRNMERRQLIRAAIVAALGTAVALLSATVRVNRLAFEVAIGLTLLAAFGLIRSTARRLRH
jgi:hypothetical protein